MHNGISGGAIQAGLPGELQPVRAAGQREDELVSQHGLWEDAMDACHTAHSA